MVHSTNTDDEDSDGVVLIVMNVRTSRKGVYTSVFWDLGCSSDFVREAYAKKMGFVGKSEHLCVTTLGGVVTDYHVTTYTCYLTDVNGEEHEFQAYGMESITGALTRIGSAVIKKLFPNLPDDFVLKLLRRTAVDFLLGMKHPSWHPERMERSAEGGDIWLYRGIFGTCVGGRHPDIKEETKRSDSLFSVNFVYHANAIIDNDASLPHTLEYCPERVTSYMHKSGFCENMLVGKSVCKSPLVESIVSNRPPECDKQVDMLREVGSEPSSDDSINALTNSEHLHEFRDISMSSKSTIICECDTPCVPSTIDGGVQTIQGLSSGSSDHPSNVSDVSVLNVVTSSNAEGDLGEESNSKECDTSKASCHSSKSTVLKSEDLFFQAEALGTTVNPQCGGCKCGKCPVPGSKYSYAEQKAFDEIQKNLKYNAYERRWYTIYPWIVPRSTLPKNDKSAYQSLATLERKLSRNPELSKEFCGQVEDMVKRGAAVILSQDQLDSWEGDYHYIPLVGAIKPNQPKNKKWLRVCSDASRRQGGYPSLNDCVHKGPDRFINNILSVWLGFRNGRVGCAADISKFHNQVYLEEQDIE